MEIKKVDHVIRYHISFIIEKFFKDESVTLQSQIFIGLLTWKKLKDTTTLLGIWKSMKYRKVKENVIQNINSALKTIERFIKKNYVLAHRAVQMVVFPLSTKENCLVKSMAKILGTSRKKCTYIGNFNYKRG